MAAMEGDGDRPLVEQRVEADEVPGFVGQDEERHRLARLRRGPPTRCSFSLATSLSTAS